MPNPLPARRQADTRHRIVEAARFLFWEKGYAATGLAELLARAGANSGSFYHFFDSKDAVLRTVLETYRDLLDPMVVRPAFRTHTRPIDRIFALLDIPASDVDLPDAELSVLQTLWERGPSTIRQLTDALYPSGTEAHYATVQKLMERLEDKGYVKHSRQRGVLVFTPRVSREELVNRRLREVAEKLCGGALAPLVMNLVRSEPLSAGELDELQAFINEERRRGKSK